MAFGLVPKRENELRAYLELRGGNETGNRGASCPDSRESRERTKSTRAEGRYVNRVDMEVRSPWSV